MKSLLMGLLAVVFCPALVFAQVQPVEKPVAAERSTGSAVDTTEKKPSKNNRIAQSGGTSGNADDQIAQDADAQQETTTSANMGPGWTVQCNTVGEDLQCRALINVFTGQNNQLIFGVSVQLAENDGAAALFTMPLGLYLPAGLSLTVDDGPPHKAIIQTCDQRGCYAGWVMTKDELQKLRAGKHIAAAFEANNRSPIKIGIPLTGFDAVFAKMR